MREYFNFKMNIRNIKNYKKTNQKDWIHKIEIKIKYFAFIFNKFFVFKYK